MTKKKSKNKLKKKAARQSRKEMRRFLRTPLLKTAKAGRSWPEESIEKGDAITIDLHAEVRTGDLAAFRDKKDRPYISRVYFHGNTIRIVDSTGRMTVARKSELYVEGKVVGISKPEATIPEDRQARIAKLREWIAEHESTCNLYREEIRQLESETDKEWSAQ